MQLKQSLFITHLILLALVPTVHAQSPENACGFTVQVASFPDRVLADKFIGKLAAAGEHPVWGTVELPERGQWIRIFVGSFKTMDAARRYGVALMNRRVIEDFIVKPESDTKLLGRPRSITRQKPGDSRHVSSLIISNDKSGLEKRAPEQRLNSSKSARPSMQTARSGLKLKSLGPKAEKLSKYLSSAPAAPLPAAGPTRLAFAPAVDTSSLPRTDPVRLAFRLIVGEGQTQANAPGGLWVTGDVKEGLARLRWIIGQENADLISVDAEGRVNLDRNLVLKATKAAESGLDQAAVAVARFITANEGLFLLVQVSQGPYRYRLHLGRQAPTLGAPAEVGGSINLDNNYDSRINPYRRNGKKLDSERPPAGFDSLVAINPIALWFNLETSSLVPVGHITFHELAEAQAKLELNLDYLAQGAQPGAHNLAIGRERMLKAQRPFSDVIITYGSNRVLRSEEEIRQFYSQAGSTGFSQR
jgi:hypothetical protein